MTGPDRVRIFGVAMIGSIVLLAVGGLVARRFLEGGGGVSAFAPLMYGTAAVLAALMATGPSLARRFEPPGGPAGNGPILAMAAVEGVTMAGIVFAAFLGQSAWLIALALAGVVGVLRVMSA